MRTTRQGRFTPHAIREDGPRAISDVVYDTDVIARLLIRLAAEVLQAESGLDVLTAALVESEVAVQPRRHPHMSPHSTAAQPPSI